MFGDLPSVFTPPWNRCAPWTAEVLHDLGFTVLSRDLSAGTAGVPGLLELPITVDWFAKRRKVPVDRAGRGELLAEAAAGDGPVGLMLHHEVMSPEDLEDVDALLALVGSHPAASAAHLDRLAQSRVPLTASDAGPRRLCWRSETEDVRRPVVGGQVAGVEHPLGVAHDHGGSYAEWSVCTTTRSAAASSSAVSSPSTATAAESAIL